MIAIWRCDLNGENNFGNRDRFSFCREKIRIFNEISQTLYCGSHINLQPPHPGHELETGMYIFFDYGTSILGQKYRDFEDCSSVEG